MISPGAAVFLQAHSEYRAVYIAMLARLKQHYGAVVHLYVGTEQQADFYRYLLEDGTVSTIVVTAEPHRTCRQPVTDAAGVIARARANEERLGCTYNEIALTDRHLGRGFALGGYRHPRSRMSEETSYLQMLAGYNAAIDFWQREIAEKKPELLLCPEKLLNVIARPMGIEVRTLAGARYRNLYYWSVDEYFSFPSLEAAYVATKGTRTNSLSSPYEAHLSFREKFRKQSALLPTVKGIASLIARHAYWRLRGYDKAKGYYVTELARFMWDKTRDIRALTAAGTPKLKELVDVPFVYFPLATEPEVALQGLSPEYFFQLEAIASVARDLPAGVLLVVKEHYAAVGRRPADFYGQIREFKNVVLLDMSELGLEVAKASRAVITITGTGGYEAAAMGKPVILLGRHNIFDFVPHVTVVKQSEELRPALAMALDSDHEAGKRQVDGRRLLEAIVECSFDLLDFLPSDPTKISDQAIDAAWQALFEGLSHCNSGRHDSRQVSAGGLRT
ncbi:MAG: capsular polysaccharide export protein, LipB/KpsS family [Hyphomicrobium sp.]